MLITASWVDEIHSGLGIKGVSQVWDEKPAWYFWIADTPGVYHLELVNAGAREQGNLKLLCATFSLKCYPFTHSRIFQSFSFEERCLIRSQYFDHTNTPHFEHRGEIPKNLFNIAKIECAFDVDETLAAFTFESLDTWRTSFKKNAFFEYPLLGKRKNFDAGEVDRQVPGTETGYLFFDRLLSLFSYHSKKPPARVLAFRSGGFELVYDQTDTFSCIDSERVKIVTTSVLYDLSGEDPVFNRVAYLGNQFKKENEDIIFDRTFSCGHLHIKDDQIPHMISLNNKWWSLAGAEFNSKLASTCGCS